MFFVLFCFGVCVTLGRNLQPPHWATSSNSFLLFMLRHNFTMSLSFKVWTCNPPASASYSAGIIGVSLDGLNLMNSPWTKDSCCLNGGCTSPSSPEGQSFIWQTTLNFLADQAVCISMTHTADKHADCNQDSLLNLDTEGEGSAEQNEMTPHSPLSRNFLSMKENAPRLWDVLTAQLRLHRQISRVCLYLRWFCTSLLGFTMHCFIV